LYYETHHIIPKSLGGSDDGDNLVNLTYREHFLVHWILTKIHTSGKPRASMWAALNAMSMPLSGRIVASWQFEVILWFVRDRFLERQAKRKVAVIERQTKTGLARKEQGIAEAKRALRVGNKWQHHTVLSGLASKILLAERMYRNQSNRDRKLYPALSTKECRELFGRGYARPK
jgi:hypothetical protein